VYSQFAPVVLMNDGSLSVLSLLPSVATTSLLADNCRRSTSKN
jgi:hypothetical protein